MMLTEATFVVRKPNSLVRALVLLRRTAPPLTLTQTILLLYVMENEGVQQKRLAQLAGLNAATTSRALRGLARADMPGALSPALGFVEMLVPPGLASARHVFLTNAGREVQRKLDVLISDATPIALADAYGGRQGNPDPGTPATPAANRAACHG